MKKNPTYSIIISNKNALKWLDKCFTSLREQTYKDFEVIFIDNASTDNSVKFVRNKFSSVKIILNDTDLGPGVAMNIAASKSLGKYLLLMNTDSYLDRNALEKISQTLKSHPEYEVAELNMKNYEKTNMTEKPYKFGMDIFGYPMPSDKLFYGDACGLVIAKKLYDTLGGFDKKFYMYLDDLDFSWRARLLGKEIQLLEDIYIYHHTGGTSVPTSSHYHQQNTYTTTLNRRFHAQKNNLRSLIKNYSLSTLWWTLPISISLAIIEGWLYLTKGNIEGFKAMHKAIWWNVVNLHDTLKERKKIQSSRVVSDKQIFKYCEKKIAKIHSYRRHGIPLMQI